jgi:hypothetical protein
LFDTYSEKELKEWIANETKNQLDRNKVRSFSDTIKKRYEMEIEVLQERIAELRDLLQLETEAAVKASEAEALREKIKARDSARDGGIAGMSLTLSRTTVSAENLRHGVSEEWRTPPAPAKPEDSA